MQLPEFAKNKRDDDGEDKNGGERIFREFGEDALVHIRGGERWCWVSVGWCE